MRVQIEIIRMYEYIYIGILSLQEYLNYDFGNQIEIFQNMANVRVHLFTVEIHKPNVEFIVSLLPRLNSMTGIEKYTRINVIKSQWYNLLFLLG